MSFTGDLVPSAPAAAIVFTGCEMQSAAAGQLAPHGQTTPTHGGARSWSTASGSRPSTCTRIASCPAAVAVIKHPLEAPGLLMDDTSTRIAAMDAQGIDVEALSINPYWYRAERDVAAELIKIQNETLVEFCAANPDRFVAFATAALQHPELAAEQVEHAVKKLGFRGVGVGGSVAGEELANPKFHPFWAKCEELGVLVFMHPLGTRELEPSGRLAGSGLLDQHDRQSARDHDRAVAPDLRGHARPLSRAEDLRRAWRRLPAVLRQPLRRGDPLLPRPGRPAAEEEADRVPARTASSSSTRSCSRPRRCAT